MLKKRAMARSRYDGVMPPQKAVIKGMIEIQDTAEVDGATWYTILVNPRVSPWIREQHKDLWYSHKTANNYKVVDTYDMHEKLYTMMALRWS
jgi:hypothetical protein